MKFEVVADALLMSHSDLPGYEDGEVDIILCNLPSP